LLNATQRRGINEQRRCNEVLLYSYIEGVCGF
jgi:hypothetical protein